MSKLNLKRTAAFLALWILTLWFISSTVVCAQAPAVDPAAVRILKSMTDYLGGLKQFSLKTQNTIEDLTGSGHRVDYDVSAIMVLKRPNKLYAERKGELIDQNFYYNGKTLTLYHPSNKVYAAQPAPGTIEGMLSFMRSSLGLLVPAADLVYPDAFSLLMEDVNLAAVIGKAYIGGVKCDHLLFSRPGVGFQVWVSESGKPLPYKYVVTDTSTCTLISISTVMSDWNVKPGVDDAFFNFVPPKGVDKISFMPLKVKGGSSR